LKDERIDLNGFQKKQSWMNSSVAMILEMFFVIVNNYNN